MSQRPRKPSPRRRPRSRSLRSSLIHLPRLDARSWPGYRSRRNNVRHLTPAANSSSRQPMTRSCVYSRRRPTEMQRSEPANGTTSRHPRKGRQLLGTFGRRNSWLRRQPEMIAWPLSRRKKLRTRSLQRLGQRNPSLRMRRPAWFLGKSTRGAVKSDGRSAGRGYVFSFALLKLISSEPSVLHLSVSHAMHRCCA